MVKQTATRHWDCEQIPKVGAHREVMYTKIWLSCR